MKALHKGTEVHIYILKLFRTGKPLDIYSEPAHKICTTEGGDRLDWYHILTGGYVPVVCDSPSILPSNVNDYLFTEEFWACSCNHGNWIHYRSPSCPICGTHPYSYENVRLEYVKDRVNKWLPSSISEAMCKVSQKSMPKEQKESFVNILQHLLYHDFNWVKAFSVDNYK